MGKLSNQNVVNHYIKSHDGDKSDKVYPNLMLIRSRNLLLENQDIDLLDFGCGYGANAISMEPYSKSITFADTSKFAIKRTEEKFINLQSKVNHTGVLINPEDSQLPFLFRMFLFHMYEHGHQTDLP